MLTRTRPDAEGLLPATPGAGAPALTRRSLLRGGALLAAAGVVGGAVAVGTGGRAYAAPRLYWHRIAVRRAAGMLNGLASKGGATWAVGSQGEGDDVRPLAMRLQAGVWRSTVQPAPDGASLAAVAVVSATNVWAVGEQIVPDTGESYPVVVRWNGSAWRPVSFPAAIGGLGHVVAAGGSIWVAGWARVDGAEHAVVYRRTGGTWTRLDRGLESSINVNCLQVFADGTAWGGLNPGMAHFDGSSWTPAPEWPTDGSMIPSRFAARGTRDVYVAGVRYTGALGLVPLISHFDGTAWRRQSSPKIQGQLYDLAWRQDQVVAVGERFDDTGAVTQLVLTQDSGTFRAAPPPVTAQGGLLSLIPNSTELLTGGYLTGGGTRPFSAISQSRITMG